MDGINTHDTDVEFKDIDEFMAETQSINSIDRAITNNLYGINHRKVKSPMPTNKDVYGYTFFTKPQLCLNDENLQNYRPFYPLLNTNKNSMHNFVRNTLDPRIQNCDLVDKKSAFINILTNTVKTVSGWPDKVAPTFTSKEGMRKEQWSIVDGTTDLYQVFDLDVTFNGNIKDEPLTRLFDTWSTYSSLVFEGVLNPYMDMIIENEIDYNTRIYRLVMSQDYKYVKKIYATGASFPVNIPIGQSADYSDERPINDQNKDITIRFPSMGAIYNDDILVYAFNKTTAIFNPSMENPSKAMDLEKVPRELIDRYNYMGYPYINPITYELEWYVDYKKEKIEKYNDDKDNAELNMIKELL